MAVQERLSSFHLITGGSGSGKSAYAESCVTAISSRRIYIATMIPYGEDGKRRVERHRNLRKEKNFETVECYMGLEQLDLKSIIQKMRLEQRDSKSIIQKMRLEQRDSKSSIWKTAPEMSSCESEALNEETHFSDMVVLLECMSNLVANEMFEPNGAGKDTVEAVMRGIEALRRQVCHLVVVTNEVFSDGITYDAETMRYLSYLGAVNREMAAQADAVTEVVYGIPVKIK
ncbi:MAG: bifunctional adenosylcobinamide kinase/adenosylcobinamide-phosphate guanylyltransferase [Lachnospiraceae bacterium]|nr:bifunctional adenosylcobinamide kinase/adenosylcobinamide-phosphate guanylyltransferase [Lachnospiraceae bacterium]